MTVEPDGGEDLEWVDRQFYLAHVCNCIREGHGTPQQWGFLRQYGSKEQVDSMLKEVIRKKVGLR